MTKANIETVKQALNLAMGGNRAANVGSQDDLFEAGLLDSLSMVQLIVELEKAFNIHFDYRDIQMDNFKTVAAISSMLESKYKAAVSL